MAYNTILEQGRVIQPATAVSVALNFRQDIDWIRVYNETAAAQAAADLGYEYFWQRGMQAAAGQQGLIWTKLGNVANDPVTVGQLAGGSGFILLDTSVTNAGAPVQETVVSNAAQPIVNTPSTAGLATGSIVRLSGDNPARNLMGVDFEIDTVVANTSFRFRYALANVPGAAGTGGFYRIIPNDPIYYPRNRFIANITQAVNPTVTTTVSHGFTVGQAISFRVSSDYGMTQLDNLVGTVLTVPTAGSFTIDIDTTGFTAYAIPTTAALPGGTFTWPQAVPVGMDTGQAIISGANLLAGATRNQAILGMTLVAGANLPGGNDGDTISWIAGKSFAVNN